MASPFLLRVAFHTVMHRKPFQWDVTEAVVHDSGAIRITERGRGNRPGTCLALGIFASVLAFGAGVAIFVARPSFPESLIPILLSLGMSYAVAEVAGIVMVTSKHVRFVSICDRGIAVSYGRLTAARPEEEFERLEEGGPRYRFDACIVRAFDLTSKAFILSEAALVDRLRTPGARIAMQVGTPSATTVCVVFHVVQESDRPHVSCERLLTMLPAKPIVMVGDHAIDDVIRVLRATTDPKHWIQVEALDECDDEASST